MDTGDDAPDFTLTDETGQQRSLSGLLEAGPVVLYFYPAAMTSGCTAESCHFRDLAAEFTALGAQRVGISPDAAAKQARFSERHSFDFPLLSDSDGAVASRFGVRRGFGPSVSRHRPTGGAMRPLDALATKRQTFVIDTDRTVLDVIKSEFRMNVHADKALEVLRSRVA